MDHFYHRSETMVWPEHIQPLLLPPYMDLFVDNSLFYEFF